MSTPLATRRICAAAGALVLPLGVLATLPAHPGHDHAYDADRKCYHANVVVCAGLLTVSG